MKIRIMNRWNQDACVFECEVPDDSKQPMRVAVEAAVKAGADLTGADLTGAVLRGADLTGAVLTGAVLTRAVLTGAVLTGAVLTGAVLRGAVLSGAVLSGADLTGADLTGAVLRGAVLTGADLSGAVLTGAVLTRAVLTGAKNAALAFSMTVIAPEGALIVWKKCLDGVLVKLRVPEAAKRSNAASRKCRAEYVEVVEVIGAEVGISAWDKKTEYRVGQTVRCGVWDANRWAECSGGIHFFLTREEAEAWEL